MKQAVGLAVALVLSSCGSVIFPKSVHLLVASVSLPASVGANEPLTISVRHGVGCGDYDQRLVLTARTATALSLSARGMNRGMGLACSAVYVEQTLTYTDPGIPTRTGPFEVVVNGRSWGTVQIKDLPRGATVIPR